MTEPTPLPRTYEPGIDPLETMLDAFKTLVYYPHYVLVETTSNPTEKDLHHIPCIKSKVEGLHTTLAPCTGFELVKLLSILGTITSSMGEKDNPKGTVQVLD